MKPEYLSLLVSAVQAAPSADNNQPHYFRWDGDTLAVRYDEARVSGYTFAATSPATLMALGGIAENIRQLADFTGIPIDVVCHGESFEQLDARPGDVGGLSHSTLAAAARLPLFERHTNRAAYRKKPVEPRVLDTAEMMAEGAARVMLVGSPEGREAVVELVNKASQIRFQTPAVHEWLGACLRFTPAEVARADGLDIRTMGLPPGGGLFMKLTQDWGRMKMLNRLGAYKFMAGVDSGTLGAAPAIFAITGSAEAPGIVDSGRLLERLWIYLNKEGLAVQPYYVVTDQLTRYREGEVPEPLRELARWLDERTRAIFGLSSGESLHMLLRCGEPSREVPRSLRLPVDSVFSVTG
jgi:hypothetical protein